MKFSRERVASRFPQGEVSVRGAQGWLRMVVIDVVRCKRSELGTIRDTPVERCAEDAAEKRIENRAG